MSEFHATVPLADIALNTSRRIFVGETPVAIAHTAEGVFAIYDQCSHADVALSEGDVSGCEIECWAHGSVFDLRTGRPLNLPATEPVPVYPVRVSDAGVIEVSLDPISPLTLEGTA